MTNDDEEFAALLQQAEWLSWIGTAVLALGLVVVALGGHVSAAMGVATGLGLTLWSAFRLHRLRRQRPPLI